MKKSLLALLLVLTSLAVLASPVDQSTAVLVARNFALSQLDDGRLQIRGTFMAFSEKCIWKRIGGQ